MPEPILLDTNVLKDISRGHDRAARALRTYIDSGRTIYIAQAAYNELLERAPDPQFRAHYREMIRDLGIRIAPPGPMSSRVELYADNITHQPRPGQPGALRDYSNRGSTPEGAVPRPGDMFIAAQAKALNAELWTHDRDFRRRAPQFGVRLAPESQLGGISGEEDPARGRRLLGLRPIHITGTGTVIRQPPRGGGGTGGGSTPPPGGGAAPPSSPPRGGAGLRAGTGVPDMRLPPTAGPSPRGQAIGGGIELLLRGIGAAIGWANERENRARIAEALQAHSAAIANRDPADGVLIALYHLVHEPVGSQRDSVVQAGPIFTHLELYFGLTESEARRAWQSRAAIRPAMAGRQTSATTVWIPPTAASPMARIASPFPRLHLATFAAGKAKLQEVEWGGIRGFDDMRQRDVPGRPSEMLFHVLQAPQTISFFNGSHRHTVDIPIVERTSGEGNVKLDAVDLDPWLGLFVTRVTAVPVFPANTAASNAFGATRATRDNLGQLRNYTNIRLMRWVRPENIKIPPG